MMAEQQEPTDEPIAWRTWAECLAAAAGSDTERANEEYNRQVAAWDEAATDVSIYSKGVPYLGWFWRDVDWAELERITIGRSSSLVGVMMSNKWGYDERQLTRDEALRFRDLLDTIFTALHDGDQAEAERVNQRLWVWMQGLGDTGHWFTEADRWKALSS